MAASCPRALLVGHARDGTLRVQGEHRFHQGFGTLSEIRLDDPPPPGFDAWLIKFDTEPALQDGRIEAAYADMARAAGISVPETRLLETAGGCHFLSRRFDRAGDGLRLH